MRRGCRFFFSSKISSLPNGTSNEKTKGFIKLSTICWCQNRERKQKFLFFFFFFFSCPPMTMTGKRREPVLVCNFDGGSVLAKGIVRRPKDNDVKIKCWSSGYQTPATILRTAGGTFFQIRIWRHWIRWLLEHRRLKSIPCRRFFL